MLCILNAKSEEGEGIQNLGDELPDVNEIILELPENVEREADFAMGDDRLIDIECEKESAAKIIIEVAKKYELNVICPDIFENRFFTLRLKGVTWSQVFELLLEPYEYTYIENRNIVKIVSYAQLSHRHPDWRIYKIHHRKASEIKMIIEEIIETYDYGKVIEDEGLNSVLIYSDRDYFRRIEEIIEWLDRRATKEEQERASQCEITPRDF